MAAPPGFTLAEEGDAVRMKSPLVTSKVSGDDVPPPGAGFFTETFRGPACAKSLAGIVAWSCVELTYVVGRGAPFTRTLEEELKLLPVTCSVSAALPGWALDGERCASCGMGLVKLIGDDVPPPGGGFMTVIVSAPLCERSPGSKVTWSKMELTKVVTRALPFTKTTESCVKPIPMTFSVSALLPAEAEPPTGCGLLIVNVTATEAEPSGFVTIT